MAIMLDAYEVTKHEQEILGPGHSLGDDLYHMASIVCHLDIYNKFPSTEVINSKLDLLPEENQEEENLSAVDMMKIFGMKYHTANLFVMLFGRHHAHAFLMPFAIGVGLHAVCVFDIGCRCFF